MNRHAKQWSFLAGLVMVAAAGVAGCSSATMFGASRAATPDQTVKTATTAPLPSSGCLTPTGPAVVNQRQNITVGGIHRWYLLTTPAPTTASPTSIVDATVASSVPRPLVLDFHGLAEGAVIHSTTTQFGALGQRDGFIVAFPNGTGSPVQWHVAAGGSANPDLQFVTAMLNQLESTQCIDTSRVYASGFSDGSFMVSLLACTMSDKFAAIAAVSGLQLPKPCHATRRVPIVSFHGTADPILFFNGGVGTSTLNQLLGGVGTTSGLSSTAMAQPANLHGAGYPATVKAWAVKDGCQPESTDTRMSSQVILRTYHCPARTEVEFYIIIGGGHAWPGSKFSQSISSLTGFTTFQINATDQIWAFFNRFQL